MAFVDFYQQSTLFNLPPHDPNLHYGFLKRSTTRLVADGDPANDLEDKSVFVDIEVFIKSVLHAPVDWKTQWAPVIHMVKRNPDFMKHYLEHRVLHKKKYAEPEESHYEPLLLMNDATLRVAFPATLSQDTPLPLTQLVLIVDDGIPGCVLNEGSSIPQLVAKGTVTQISHDCFQLTGNRGTSTLKPHEIHRLVAIHARKRPEAETRLGFQPRVQETKTGCHVRSRKSKPRD